MTDQRKDEMLNQGDDVVERLKDAAERMLNGEIIGHNLSVFATDILTILNRAASSPPVPDDVADTWREMPDITFFVNKDPTSALGVWAFRHYQTLQLVIRAARTPSAALLDKGWQGIDAANGPAEDVEVIVSGKAVSPHTGMYVCVATLWNGFFETNQGPLKNQPTHYMNFPPPPSDIDSGDGR
jgi:hypothetical protein